MLYFKSVGVKYMSCQTYNETLENQELHRKSVIVNCFDCKMKSFEKICERQNFYGQNNS